MVELLPEKLSCEKHIDILNDQLKLIVFSIGRLVRVKKIIETVECCAKNAKKGFFHFFFFITDSRSSFAFLRRKLRVQGSCSFMGC